MLCLTLFYYLIFSVCEVDKAMSDRTTLISEWHNITNELPSVKLNSMFFQDMLSIIKNLKDAEILQRWEEVKQSLYEHVTDTDNPHHLTSEQLSVNVINILYSAWLSEGYSGTLQEFIDMIFNYIQITDVINEEVSPEDDWLVPTVKALADYVENYHNAKITDIHEELLNDIFFGDIIDIPPTIYLNKYIGVPAELIPEDKNDFVTISSTGTDYSICVESKYANQSLFTLKNNTKTITTQLNVTTNEIIITINRTQSKLNISDLFSDTLSVASEILFIFVNNGNTLECYCRLQGMYNNVLVQSNYKKWTIGVRAISDYKQILFPTINDSSNAISFRYDKIAFSEEYAKKILGSYI